MAPMKAINQSTGSAQMSPILSPAKNEKIPARESG